MDSRKMQWFLEQVNARQNPITDQQIDRFCRNPSGPILPDELVTARRLILGEGEICTAIEVDPSGELCYIHRKKTGRYFVETGKRSWRLNNPYRPEAKNVVDAILNLGNDAVRDVAVIGFNRDNVPIARMEFSTRSSSDGLGAADDLLFRGEQALWNPHASREFPIGINERANAFMTRRFHEPEGYEDIVYIRDLTTGGLIRTNGFEGWKYFQQAFLASDDSLYVIGHGPTGPNLSLGRLDANGKGMLWTKPGGSVLSTCDHTYEFVEIDGCVHLVWSRDRGNCFTTVMTFSEEKGEWLQKAEPISTYAYWRGLKRMQSGSWAFVGSPTRHGGECWIVDNKEHPQFRRVSRLFMQDRCWHYYGVTMDGKYVCLMQLPVTPSDK